MGGGLLLLLLQLIVESCEDMISTHLLILKSILFIYIFKFFNLFFSFNIKICLQEELDPLGTRVTASALHSLAFCLNLLINLFCSAGD